MRMGRQTKFSTFLHLLSIALYIVKLAQARSYKSEKLYKVYKPKENEGNNVNAGDSVMTQNNTLSTDEILKPYRQNAVQKAAAEDEELRKTARDSFQHKMFISYTAQVPQGVGWQTPGMAKVEDPSSFVRFWRKLKEIIGFDPFFLVIIIAETVIGLAIMQFAVWYDKNRIWIKRTNTRGGPNPHATQVIQPPSSPTLSLTTVSHEWVRTESENFRRLPPSLPISIPPTPNEVLEVQSPFHHSTEPQVNPEAVTPKVDNSPPAYDDLDPESRPPSFDTVVEIEKV